MYFIWPQNDIKKEQIQFQQKIQVKQKMVQELKQAADTIKVRCVHTPNIIG